MTTNAYKAEAPLTTQGAKRLLKLAKFLREMPRAKFDFSVIMKVGGKSPLEALKAGKHRCGTAGCAVGWMPAVWPRLLDWNEYGEVTMGYLSNFAVAEEMFGISNDDANFLFQPESVEYDYDIEGNETTRCNTIPNNASAKRVARHITKFVCTNYAGKAKLDFGA